MRQVFKALKPQDLLVALKVAVNQGRQIEYGLAQLASALDMPLSSLHGAVTRAEHSRLLSRSAGSLRAVRPAVLEFVLHGVKYAFPAQLGATTRGMPTGIGGPGLRTHFEALIEVPVWPDPEGKVRGPAIEPLAPNVIRASLKDDALYNVLTLIDALRSGAARERNLASEMLLELLG